VSGGAQARLNPRSLSLARDLRGMSQSVLAKEVGVTQPFISQIEKGARTPTTEMVEAMAQALDCATSLLMTDLLPSKLPVTFFRKTSRTRIRDMRALRARVVLYRHRLGILLRYSQHLRLRISLGDVTHGRYSPRVTAQRLREFWGVPPGPIDNLTELVEQHGIMVIPGHYGPTIDGFSVHESWESALPPTVFMDTSVPGDRWRLSLAHEVGHILLHYHQDVLPNTRLVEREAFDFASEFLFPQREIGGHLHVLSMYRLAQLKMRWKVSMASLLLTAERTGRISPYSARRLWIQLRSGGRDEPVKIDREHPMLLNKIVDDFQKATGLTTASISRVLHYRRPEQFRRDFVTGMRAI